MKELKMTLSDGPYTDSMTIRLYDDAPLTMRDQVILKTVDLLHIQLKERKGTV